MDLTPVASFQWLWQAGMAKSVLEAEGIPALVDNETVTQLGYLTWTAPAGVRVLVPEDRLAEAREVLARQQPESDTADTPGNEDCAGQTLEEAGEAE
jgi:hypothetical protein